MGTYSWVHYAVKSCGVVGIFANALVIYIVQSTVARLGKFKYLLIYFSAVEIVFSIIVLLANPFAYAYDNRLIMFSHSTVPFIAHSNIGRFLIGLYCSFYEIWMGVVVVMFIFKYIVLCRSKLAEKIERYWKYKVAFLILYLAHVVYSFICGIGWCLNIGLPKELEDYVGMKLNRSENENYHPITLKAPDGSFSIFGFLSTIDHLGYAAITGTVAIYCGREIWKSINTMYTDNSKEYKANLQVFYALVLQAAIPFILYQIPTFLVVLDSLMEKEPILIDLINMWSIFVSLPKAIDPFIILLLINDYRRATYRLFRRMFVCTARSLHIPANSVHTTQTTGSGVNNPNNSNTAP